MSYYFYIKGCISNLRTPHALTHRWPLPWSALPAQCPVLAWRDSVGKQQVLARLARLPLGHWGDIARARGMMQLARDTGITREGLYKALGEQGNPSFATVIKVMHALGLQFNVGARSV